MDMPVEYASLVVEVPEDLAVLWKATRNNDLQVIKSLLSRGNARKLVTSVDRTGYSALHIAARFNTVEAAKLLLKHGADCNVMTPTRSSPLNIACRFRNEEILRLFLDHGGNPLLMHNTDGNTLHIIAKGSERRIAELIFEGSKTKIPVNTADVYGMTPLHHAAQTGNMEMCKWLLMHKAKPRVKDFRKGTPFHLACRQGHINIMTLLLQADSSEKKQLLHLMADADDEGNTALHHACLDNRMQVVKTLLDWGADANVLNKSHWVPLHFCALNDHKELVPELLRHRADPETRDIHGRTPLHIAAGYRKIDTISALVDGGAKINERDTENSTPLLIACKKGHIDVVKLLITLGADLTIRGSFDKTCLHIATEEGHAEVLQVLLENCDSRLVEAQDIFNQNALHVAAVQKNAILARTLIQHGCSANEREIVGRIPLHLAAGLSSYETVITVAEATKDVNQECYDMKSPFFMACETGNRPAITALIEKGAIIRDTDTFFRNTLMVAAIGGYSDIVEDLIKMGIQVETKDKERNTALHYACAHGHLTTVSALLHHGAKVSDINVYGQSPLDMAVDREMSDVAVFLMQHYTWEESMSVKDKHGRTCLDRMIRKTPLAVKVLLDNCMKTSNNQEVDEEYTVELNYRYIDPLPDKHITEYLHNNPLLTMLEKEREDLLSHPVCQGLLSYKWHIYGRLSLFMNLTMQFVFIGLVVFLFFISFHKPTKSDRSHDCDFVKGMSANETGTRQEFHETHLFVIEILLYITMAMLYIKELSHAFIVGWRFLFSFQFFNLTVSLSLMVYATSPPGYKPCATQWRAVAYSLFLFFLLTIWMYQRIDFIGLYFSMFFEVLHTMLKLLLLMFFFLVLFAVPMYVMLDVEGFRKGQPFILTVLAMTTGELNFRDNFVLPDNTPFSIDLYIMFSLFSLVMPLCLTNLMIGVAVGDINKVEKRAYLLRLKTQVEFLLETEYAVPMAIRCRFYLDKLVVKPNAKSKRLSFLSQARKWILFKGNRKLMQFIKKGRFENPDDDSTDEVKVQLANHSARLEKQSQLLQTALETIQHLAERLETQTTKSS